MALRIYQQECVDTCLSWVRKSTEPAVVEATVSFGKTRTISAIAASVRDMSKKKVLILCPNGVLAKQNYAQIVADGHGCSIFSASGGAKSTRHDIVVGTPQSIKNALSRFGAQFACILIDEGEGLTASVIAIVNNIRDHNPNVRIIGFTGTPYRTGTGYVYQYDIDDKPVKETIEPFYFKCIHRTSTKDLTDLGYLTPMVIGQIGADTYETSKLELNSRGKFDAKAVVQCYIGRGRKTAAIVQDAVSKWDGVGQMMFFAASKDHCREIMESMPHGFARMVCDGEPNNAETIKAFARGDFTAIVNVDMLTVGADFPRVSTIVLMRKTESARLLQQILGRGIRLLPDVSAAVNLLDTPETRRACIAASAKPFCTLLDYTEDNAETHYPDGDLWSPIIKARIRGEGSGDINCKCPLCDGDNVFSARKNDEGYEVDENGYFADLAGTRIEHPDYGPIPAHFGRRCMCYTLDRGQAVRCEYRWTSKECPHCGADNDIAARRCCECKGEIVDPNQKLHMDFKALKKDPYQVQCDEVTSWSESYGVTSKGRERTRVDIVTPFRSFSWWVMKDPLGSREFSATELLKTLDGTTPKTVTYKKEASGFYVVLAFNKEKDEM